MKIAHVAEIEYRLKHDNNKKYSNVVQECPTPRRIGSFLMKKSKRAIKQPCLGSPSTMYAVGR